MVPRSNKFTAFSGWTPSICAFLALAGVTLYAGQTIQIRQDPAIVLVDDPQPPPPEPEADPDQALKDWLEYLRKLLENTDFTDQKSAEQLIAEIDEYTRIMGLSDAIVANQYWFAAYLELGETLRASASSLEPLSSFKLAETIDRMRTQLEQVP
ncbi:MAG TPA: hypothetical protein PL072_10775 [Phycisphaerales bacterium]|mgnify:CR=1 FL=1|nr:hypothetical protein [Phycisphaerales bacterium]